MTGREQAEKLWTNIRELGARRLVALGLIGVTVLLAIGLGTYHLSKPERETLYSGLNREDVSRIGSVLKDAGIGFDVSSDGTSVLVRHADTAQARMLLAEKGLPQSSNSGYELFNELGSFGLTSFMQEVTRVRALEGELARTIQTMKGIKAARVHIVLPDRGSFRREQQPASASVVIRTEMADDASAAQAIRHLVAAAIPAMKIDGVTVLNTEGAVLASGDDSSSAAGSKMQRLEQQISREIEENIRRTLTPYLGMENFEISVASRLNTDQTTVNETTFDPASQVARSVRVIKENGVAQNSSTQAATSVQQNIPLEEMPGQRGNNSNEENQRREELTNYEISSKVVQTVHDGYEIENLSIAVLVNKDRLAASAGEGAAAVPVETQLMDIEQLVVSAAGFKADRGDQLKVAAVTFANGGKELEPVPPLGMTELLMRQLGTLINAGAILITAVLLIWFGLRPAVKAILAKPAEAAMEMAMLHEPQAAAAMVEGGAGAAAAALAAQADVNLIEDLTSKMSRSPQKRLEQIVDFNEEQAAAILRQWIRQDERA
jgi:flagellar M-ring protein FliF